MREVRGFVRLCGGALIAGGALAALLNLVLSPMLPADAGSVAVVTSAAFGVRMPLAAASVALTTLGCVGLYLAQAHRLRLGALAFGLAGIGGLLTFWLEVVQVTLVRDLGFAAPETLVSLEEAGGLVRYDATFAAGAAVFMLGWISVAIVTLQAGVLPRRGPLVFVVGLFLVPLLGVLAGVWGAAIGNVVVGAGWTLLGVDLRATVAGEGPAALEGSEVGR